MAFAQVTKLLVGLVVGLVATVLASFGLALQRKSHLNLPFSNQMFYNNSLGKFVTRNLWAVGFTVYLVSAITGSLFSIGSLPVTLLAPLGAFSLVCNAVFARFLLDDPWSWQAGAGTSIILVGAGVVGAFGALPEYDRSLDDLLVLYGRTQFIVYFAVQNALILAGLVWNTSNAYRLDRAMGGAGLGRGWNNRLPFPTLTPSGNRTVVGLVYGLISILISTQGILFAKSGIELLVLTLGGQNQFDRPLAWIVVVCLIVASLAQLYYLNRAVVYCDIVLLMPCNYCSYNISCLLNGLVYYDQWGMLSWWKLLLVALGTLLLSFGVVVLSFRPQNPDSVAPQLSSPVGSDAEFAAFLAGDVTPPRIAPPLGELAQHLPALSQAKNRNSFNDELSPLLPGQIHLNSPDYHSLTPPLISSVPSSPPLPSARPLSPSLSF